jgi:hypothetical protein
VNGRAVAWFWGTQMHYEGRISAGGVTRDVTFVDAKGYFSGIAGSVLTPQARSATIGLIPRPTTS